MPDANSLPSAEASQRLYNVAVVGATGAVGVELIGCLERRGFPVGSLRLLASPRSAGRTLSFRGHEVPVEALGEESFQGIDIALFSAGASISRQYAPLAVEAGAVVVDNSSAFRMDPSVPLVVPEANAAAIREHRGIIANPNCVAAIAVMALAPLHVYSPIKRVIAATYQAASGAGAAAMEELRASTAAYLEGRPYRNTVLKHPYAFNLFSHDSAVDPETGYNGEETKVVEELRKMLGKPALRVGVTAVRVPVLRAHSMALTVEFEWAITAAEVTRVLQQAPGVRIVNDVVANHFPMPLEASGQDEVLIGRIREDVSDGSGRSISLFVVGDQLLKGAALNAVQIAERVIGRA